MEGKRSTKYVWMIMAIAIVIMVAENGKKCGASSDTDKANKDTSEDTPTDDDTVGMASSWAAWAKEKTTGKWSLDNDMKDSSQDMMDTVGDKASDASKYVSDKAHDAKESSKDAYDYSSDKVGDAYSATKDKMGDMADGAKDMAGEAKDKVSGAYESTKDKVKEVTK